MNLLIRTSIASLLLTLVFVTDSLAQSEVVVTTEALPRTQTCNLYFASHCNSIKQRRVMNDAQKLLDSWIADGSATADSFVERKALRSKLCIKLTSPDHYQKACNETMRVFNERNCDFSGRCSAGQFPIGGGLISVSEE